MLDLKKGPEVFVVDDDDASAESYLSSFVSFLKFHVKFSAFRSQRCRSGQ